MIFEVNLSNGAWKTVRVPAHKSSADAMMIAQTEANEPLFVGEPRATTLAAEGRFTARDGYLVPIEQATALWTRQMLEVYMDGGYCLVPAPDLTGPNGSTMTAKAHGISYQKWRDQGWTDAALIAEGFMTAPPSPAA